jgi:hypothetical protein
MREEGDGGRGAGSSTVGGGGGAAKSADNDEEGQVSTLSRPCSLAWSFAVRVCCPILASHLETQKPLSRIRIVSGPDHVETRYLIAIPSPPSSPSVPRGHAGERHRRHHFPRGLPPAGHLQGPCCVDVVDRSIDRWTLSCVRDDTGALKVWVCCQRASASQSKMAEPARGPPPPTSPNLPNESTRTQARLQNPGSEFRSTWQVVQQTLKHEGVSGLYRGLGTVVSIGTPAFVLYLATYEQAKRSLCAAPALQEYQFVGHFLAGMTAETVRYVCVRAFVCAMGGLCVPRVSW